MKKFTGKVKHKGKAENHPHINMTQPEIMRRVQTQDIENSFEIKKDQVKQSCIYTDCCIKTLW